MRKLVRSFVTITIAVSSFLLVAGNAFAWPAQVAPELNFTNWELNQAWSRQENRTYTSNPTALTYQQRFADEVKRRCAECKISEMYDKYYVRKYRVTLPSKWYFDITLDPAVIEITAEPLIETKMVRLQDQMNSLIWDTARTIGLQAPSTYPGHLNFGIKSTFGKNALLFHNFVVDYLNHYDLVVSTLGYRGYENAPHPEQLPRPQADALARIFRDFDPKKSSIEDLARSIYTDVYHTSTVFGGGDGEPSQKYHAVNISSLLKYNDPWPRLELRAVPMQTTPEELTLMTRLFTARIEYLKTKRTKVEYTASGRRSGSSAQQVEEFFNYVTESGLDWGVYSKLMLKYNPGLRSGFELFSSRPKSRSYQCSALFKR